MNQPYITIDFECPICHIPNSNKYNADQSSQYIVDRAKQDKQMLFCKTCVVKLHIPDQVDVGALIAENATLKFKMSLVLMEIEELRADNMKLVEYLIVTDPSFVDQSLRDAGYDPDEIGKKFGEFARNLLDQRRKELGLDTD